MQRKELMLLAAFAVFSAIFSYFISGLLLSTSDDRRANVEVVEIINSDFPLLPSEYFNDQSINPTQDIVIEPGNNDRPFGDGAQ